MISKLNMLIRYTNTLQTILSKVISSYPVGMKTRGKISQPSSCFMYHLLQTQITRFTVPRIIVSCACTMFDVVLYFAIFQTRSSICARSVIFKCTV